MTKKRPECPMDRHEILLGLNPETALNLSAVVWTGEHLWLASDETSGLERLSVTPTGYGAALHFDLAEYIDLFDNGETDIEIDIEGLDYRDSYLWVVGSHATKRKRVRADRSERENIRRLAKVETDPNRFLLARIPLVGGELHKVCADPQNLGEYLTSAVLPRNRLLDILEDDPHLGAFLSAKLPGKDNGFDIEGLATAGARVCLGLRGPVLRGWAMLLALTVEERNPGVLKVKRDNESQLYQKYFLDLDGLGIRELCWQGADLLILAGPTMVLDGSLRIFRWVGGPRETTLIAQETGVLEVVCDIPHGYRCDRAEGITLVNEGLLVVYDTPHPGRIVEHQGIHASVIDLGLAPD